MNKKYIILCLFALLLLGSGCDDFLDVVPDDRAELDTDKKLNQLMTGSYTGHLPNLFMEYLSDDIDHRTYPENIALGYTYQEEAYLWQDIKDESGNDAPKDFWSAAYTSIAASNQVIKSIEEQGNPEGLLPLRGEALLLRAFNHFLLVNIYGKHYCEATAETDMGIVYMEAPETDLNPYYERESVAEIYRKIDRDIEEALPLIRDNIYTYPKYRFNQQAALAFATRFNLYYGKYGKVIQYANAIFGNNPEPLMRDKYAFKSLPRTSTNSYGDYKMHFTSLDEVANFLIITACSSAGSYIGSSSGKLYQHSYFIALYETMRSAGPWGAYSSSTPYTFNIHSLGFTPNNYVYMPNIYQVMKKESPTASSGVNYSDYVTFWAEETLLCRAEAYIVTGEYDKATADLDLWMRYQIDPTKYAALTRAKINSYYSGLAYYKPEAPTPKKTLSPVNFALEEGSEQENFIQCLLHFRRIETIHLGLRWFDVKRFGITIYRRDVKASGSGTDVLDKVTDTLLPGDPRRAIQIPPDVISAGMTPTPR